MTHALENLPADSEDIATHPVSATHEDREWWLVHDKSGSVIYRASSRQHAEAIRMVRDGELPLLAPFRIVRLIEQPA